MFDVLSALDGAVIVLGVMVYLGALVAIVLPDHRNPVCIPPRPPQAPPQLARPTRQVNNGAWHRYSQRTL